MKFSGKTEIENRHTTILQGLLKGSKLETLHATYREVQPGLVIATVFLEAGRIQGSRLRSQWFRRSARRSYLPMFWFRQMANGKLPLLKIP